MYVTALSLSYQTTLIKQLNGVLIHSGSWLNLAEKIKTFPKIGATLHPILRGSTVHVNAWPVELSLYQKNKVMQDLTFSQWCC